MALSSHMTASPLVLLWVIAILAVVESGVQASLSEDTVAVLMGRATTNLQTFQGDLAGVTADPITQSTDTSRPYEVDGDTFQDYTTAVGRSCDNQHNSCADAVNTKEVTNVTVADCDTQNTECKAAAASATQTAFTVLTTTTTEFDIFCDL